MAATDRQRQEAEQLVEAAARLQEQGDRQEALAALRRAMLLYAEADRLAQIDGGSSPLSRRVRAEVCERCADWLMEAEQYAEAANLYQEASDLYGESGGDAGEQGPRRCAHKALTCVTALRSRPHDRLYLLTEHYERHLRQLALQSDTAAQQGDCCAHIAAIFMRRDHPQEAVARYREALALYARAPQTESVHMARAECHHRIAGMMANSLKDLHGAVRHYREAIALYTAHEPSVYGLQEERTLCARALADVERRLERMPH